MPPSRRSGRANTSKGTTTSGNARADVGGSSSSGLKGEDEAGSSSNPSSRRAQAADEERRRDAQRRALEEQEARQREEEAEQELQRIHDLLERFDEQAEPLKESTCDAKLKSLRNDWASLEGNFEIAYQLAAQVAERLAEARVAEGLIEEDEKIQEIDGGLRGMIDLQETVKHRRRALEAIRGMVSENKEVLDAAKMYTDLGARLDEEYDEKTTRQKYASSKVYKEYKSIVWAALREDDMPALVDIIPLEAGDEDDGSDDEIVAYGGDKQQYKCPISLNIMVDPLKSTVCQHAFEKKHILDLLGSGTKQCPTGCVAKLNKNTLKADPKFTRACHKYAERQELRRERARTQLQGTMID
ncbi:hypothetical protein CBS101457_002670 [Exobasidium rhododendri]|nr:hypothetical protein CBS101457_002670 [Exobasidium rhododendri]